MSRLYAGPATLVACLALLAVPAAAEPRLASLQVALEGREVKVSFELEGGFDEALMERIEAGLSSGFSYRFRLYRDHQRWFDSTLDAASLDVVAVYNAVTDEYLVNTKRDGELIGSQVLHDPEELASAMTRFAGIHLFTVDPSIPADWRLLIRARAQLDDRGRFLFVPTSVATPWERSRKFRVAPVP